MEQVQERKPSETERVETAECKYNGPATGWALWNSVGDGLRERPDSEQIRKDFLEAYETEIAQMISSAPQAAGEAKCVMADHFRIARNDYGNGKEYFQYILEFATIDSGLPQTDAVNFHGQQTSTWIYAGAVVIDQDGRVSRHH